jgi:hypothetical protein
MRVFPDASAICNNQVICDLRPSPYPLPEGEGINARGLAIYFGDHEWDVWRAD